MLMYFIRQLLQCQWARTQHNLQNECMMTTDLTARLHRLMSIFTSSLHITCNTFLKTFFTFLTWHHHQLYVFQLYVFFFFYINNRFSRIVTIHMSSFQHHFYWVTDKQIKDMKLFRTLLLQPWIKMKLKYKFLAHTGTSNGKYGLFT